MANGRFGQPFSITGPMGPIGPVGQPGANGTSLLPGDGAPSDEIGSAGDTYLDLLSGDLYSPKGPGGWGNAVRNILGKQGDTGPVGARGSAGASLLAGYQPPSAKDGENGDSYFCQQNGSVYGPKADGAWPTQGTSLVGPSGDTGSQGTIIYPLSDAPDDSMGRDGDFALDTAHHQLYGPKYGTWGAGVSVVGPRGEVGPVGPQGVAGATFIQGAGAPPKDQGRYGDYWLDAQGSVLYGPRTADANQPWPVDGFTFRGAMGPEGPQGPAGFMGRAGNSFIIAAADPTPADGADGDTWFNKSSGYIYGPKANGGWDLSTGDLIQGATGPKGERGEAGPVGPAGVGFLTGEQAPDDSYGESGQYYYASKLFLVYGPKNGNGTSGWGSGKSLAGPKGDVGPAGPASTVPGPRGLGIYLRPSAPQNDFGQDGEGVITASGAIYGPKTGGAWGTAVGSLVGPKGDKGDVGPAGNASTVAGPAGASFLTGTGKPSSTYGNDGDSFFDQDARAIYLSKANGAWPSTAVSLVGATGAPGAVGASGKDGSNGTVLRYGSGAPKASTVSNDGDFYIDQTNTRLYGPRANGAWDSSYVPLIGPTGNAGSAGPKGDQGPSGAQLVSTTGAPASSLGVAGAFAIDTQQAFLYGPKDATTGWNTNPVHLVGPQGPAGAATQQVHDLGCFWTTGGNCPTDYAGYARAIVADRTGQTAGMDGTFPMPNAGSVRSLYGWVNGSVAGTLTWCLFVNGNPTAATATYSSNAAGPWYAEFASGAVKVGKYDVVQLRVKGDNTAIDQSLSGFMLLEVAS